MGNRYNIDDYVFFTENDIMDIDAVNITMGQVVKIEKKGSTHPQIIYTVKCLYAVTHSKKKWKGLKEMDENCLYRDLNVLECLVKKM